MVRSMFAKVTAGAVVALALFAWTGQANAFGHHRWHGSSGGGSSGGWGSSGGGWGGSSGGWGSSGGGWGGSSGGWGSSGGGWGGHKHGHGGWRWSGSSGGSSGGYWGGSSGGSSGGWGSSGGGSSGGTYYYSPGVPMMPVDPSMAPPAGAPEAAPAPTPAPGTSTSNTRADGLLAVSVPQDAKIFVNGQATSSTGDMRQYVSRDLQSGYNYSYEVRAEVVRDGRTVEQVKKVDLRAGETANLAFDFGGGSSVETSLTLHVPSDAKVYLAGNATKAGGETRVFRTTGLSGSKTWDGYTIRVELDRGGRTLTKEETISLKAGESQELRFDFDGDKIASTR